MKIDESIYGGSFDIKLLSKSWNAGDYDQLR